jgi:putative Ca2+/H+ antiporter (TMEM165/GDT1 family)
MNKPVAVLLGILLALLIVSAASVAVGLVRYFFGS